MAFKTLLKSESLARYVNVDVLHETDLQRRLRAETAKLPQGGMQISADQGALLSMLIALLDARRVIEIGTFTGYSALCMAAALPPEGMLIACDISEEWTRIGRRYWKEAGVESKIDLRLAPAQQTLDALIAQGQSNTFDLAFIDADKDPYPSYYEACLQLVRKNGVIVMDNVLMGRSPDASQFDPAKDGTLHALNMTIRNDDRAEAMIATVGAGFMIVRKK